MSEILNRDTSDAKTVEATFTFNEREGSVHEFLSRKLEGGPYDDLRVCVWDLGDGRYEVELIDLRFREITSLYKGRDLYAALKVFAHAKAS